MTLDHDWLAFAARSPHRSQRLDAARNPRTPKAALEALLSDTDPLVAGCARNNPAARNLTPRR